MTLFLIALGMGVVLTVALLWFGGEGYKTRHDIAGALGVILGFMCILGLAGVAILSVNWVGAKHKADILNREYGTDYTQAEVFYAADVIDTVRQLDRKRYEINGDLFKGE